MAKIVTRTVKARAHRILLHISPLKRILKNKSYPFCKKFLPNMNRPMNVVRENTKKINGDFDAALRSTVLVICLLAFQRPVL